MKGIVGFGETVVDFLPQGLEDGNPVYKACPGGSVANVTAAVASLGVNSAYVGGVGDDFFGHFLTDRIHSYGVDTSQVVFRKEFGTSLVFVNILENDQRDYSYANRPSAEQMLTFEDINFDRIRQYRVLHVSSNIHYDGTSGDAQKKLLAEAKNSGMIVSYDVNYRPNNHKSLDRAKLVFSDGISFADVIKTTTDELQLVTGESGQVGAAFLFEHGAKVVLETLGSQGVAYYLPDCSGHVPAEVVKTVDTTGAGDWFFAGFLTEMLRLNDLTDFTKGDVVKACQFGNHAAGFSVTQSGAMIRLPENFSLHTTKNA